MTREWVFSGVVLRWDFVATVFRWTASRICEMRWVVRTVGREELRRRGDYACIRRTSIIIIMSETVLYCYSFERP